MRNITPNTLLQTNLTPQAVIEGQICPRPKKRERARPDAEPDPQRESNSSGQPAVAETT
jgi:hypothetical protein